MGSYLIYWQHNHSPADKAPECQLLSDDTSQCLHSLAPVLQSLGRGKIIPQGAFCTAGRIRAASSSQGKRTGLGFGAGSRRGLEGEGRWSFAIQGGCTQQLALREGLQQDGGLGKSLTPAPAAPWQLLTSWHKARPQQTMHEGYHASSTSVGITASPSRPAA